MRFQVIVSKDVDQRSPGHLEAELLLKFTTRCVVSEVEFAKHTFNLLWRYLGLRPDDWINFEASFELGFEIRRRLFVGGY
jgi:hypothetical protein